MNLVKGWPWQRIFTGVALSLVLAGIAPLSYLFWWGLAHNLEPLSVPIALKRGEFTSPFFTTDLDDDYQIEIYFLPYPRTPLNLDWTIVNETGAVIRSGSYRDEGGNDAIFERSYRPPVGSRQRITLDIQEDVQGAASDVRLHVSLPERSLGLSYAFPEAVIWASIVAGAGASMLLVLFILRANRR
jgi:hypothetical protein